MNRPQLAAADTLPSLLIVDDDPLIRDSLRLSLARDFDIQLAESRAQAIRLLRDSHAKPQLALIDLGLPPVPHRPDEGFHLIAELLTHAPDIRIIALSGQSDESNARHARTLGAFDFIAKPCSPEDIRLQLQAALRLEQRESDSGNNFPLGIVGQSAATQAMLSQIALYATTPFPVLIEGESGSGKELIASALQQLGPNKSAPFLTFNCAAISPNLAEATLFGHSKGAFTGAQNAAAGYFEDAGDGTLFLDEIGELPLEMQAKLLRVLENGEYQRVGETAARKSRARIIAATNRNLRDEVRAGRFRNDLYHRLSVFTIAVPPLRELGADKFLLLNHFREFYSAQAKQQPFELDASALQAWERYPFPGNTRELRNIVIRLATKHPGKTITAAQLETELDLQQDMPASTALPQQAADELQQPGFHLEEKMLEQERHYIEAALKLTNSNVSEAARLLGINRTTLYSRMDVLQKRQTAREGKQ